MSHTINIAELTDYDALLRLLLDIQGHGTSYTLVKNEVEVAKFVPVKPAEERNDKVSVEVLKQRQIAMAEAEELSQEIAQKWKTSESAVEAVINNRR